MSELQAIREDVREVKAAVERIEHALNGNGMPGIKTRLYVIEQWIRGAGRMVWVVIGAAVTSVVGGVVTVLGVIFKGIGS